MNMLLHIPGRLIVSRSSLLLPTVVALLLLTLGCKDSASSEAEREHIKNNEGQRLIAAYLEVHEVLAKDSVEGVSSAAETIREAAASLSAAFSGVESEGALGGVANRLEQQALTLSRASDLSEIRTIYKALSESMIQIRSFMSWDSELVVVHCPMMKGNWLQLGTAVSNPYHGTEMPRCGTIVQATP